MRFVSYLFRVPLGCWFVFFGLLLPPILVLRRGLLPIVVVTLLTLLGWLPGLIAALIYLYGDYINQNRFQSKYSQTKFTYRDTYAHRNPNDLDFRVKLMVLSVAVLKADERNHLKEQNFVRKYFVEKYGRVETNRIIREYNGNPKYKSLDLETATTDLRHMMDYEYRLSVLHFMFSLAQIHRGLSNVENEKIRQIATLLKISANDFERLKFTYVDQTSNSHQILGVSKGATDQEIKFAYRKLVKKYHPDRIATADPETRDKASKKFQQIQKAYEDLKVYRGL